MKRELDDARSGDDTGAVTRAWTRRLVVLALVAFIVFAMLHQFGWGTGSLVLAGFAVLALVGWRLPVPKRDRHADPAGQGWRGPTF